MSEWTNEDIEILKKEYSSHTPLKDISTILGKSIGSIRNKAYRLKITDTSDNWTKEQIDFLKENHSNYPLVELAKILGNRNESNVARKLRELGITRSYTPSRNSRYFRDEHGVSHKKGWKRKTKEEIADKRSKIMKEWYKTHDHPRGMLGKKQSEETRKKFSQRMINDWKNPKSSYNSEEFRKLKSDLMHEQRIKNYSTHNCYSRTKSGKRKDLNNMFFRSSWEANYARYLNFLKRKKLIYKWEYEPDVFEFKEIKKGTRSYIPDFKIWETKESTPYYVEVKGWMDEKSKVKLKRMSKYYPKIKVILFQQKDYKDLKNKLGRIIENWED